MKKIIVKTLEIDVSNTCWNVCQWCYHNKIQKTKLTSLYNFNIYINNFFNIINNDSIDSLALYWGNLIEKEECSLYIEKILKYDYKIKSYLFSTSFWIYNQKSKNNLKYIIKNFKNKDFIFQFFYNYENSKQYLLCLSDIIKDWNIKQIFFAVQLVKLDKIYLNKVINSIINIFNNLWYNDKNFIEKLEQDFLNSINWKNRTEDLFININGINILFMIVYPVNKIWKNITSVVWNNCSFFNSTNIKENIIELWMLSIEYDWYVNFHNPNCIASLQKIFNICDYKTEIYKKLFLFYKFLLYNEKNNKNLLEKCNNCLEFNLNNKWVFEKK